MVSHAHPFMRKDMEAGVCWKFSCKSFHSFLIIANSDPIFSPANFLWDTEVHLKVKLRIMFLCAVKLLYFYGKKIVQGGGGCLGKFIRED